MHISCIIGGWQYLCNIHLFSDPACPCCHAITTDKASGKDGGKQKMILEI